jgi:hypothetical protein
MAKSEKSLSDELAKMLGGKFRGMKVSIENSPRWNRKCVTFVWSGFEGLLPEERFHRLTTAIPAEFRDKQMKGFVWLELTPGQDVDEFLAMPRSEDVGPRAQQIRKKLEHASFFDALSKLLGDCPQDNCAGDFTQTISVLKKKNWKEREIVDAKLLFIHDGVYCDCQVK